MGDNLVLVDSALTLSNLQASFHAALDSGDGVSAALGAIIELGNVRQEPSVRVHAAIILKESGYYSHALEILNSIVPDDPSNEIVRYELVNLLRRMAQHEEADRVLLQSFEIGVFDGLLSSEAAFRMFLEGGVSKCQNSHVAHALIKWAAINRGAGSDANRYVSSFVRYAINNNSTLEKVRIQQRNMPLLGPEETYAKVSRAIRARRPFAVVRFGDGEGSLLARKKQDPSEEYFLRVNKQKALERWFGDQSLLDSQSFLDHCTELSGRVGEIDILGIPNLDWIEHELRNRSLRGFANCLNAASFALMSVLKADVTSNSSAVDMEYRGLLTKLIGEASKVVIVTCHTELGSRLSTVVTKPINIIEVPPAASDRSITRYEMHESHFRQSRLRVVDQIRAIAAPGVLVLIAAGFLGKTYTLEAKISGAVAVDIGSIADLWMGFITRTNFANLAHRVIKM